MSHQKELVSDLAVLGTKMRHLHVNWPDHRPYSITGKRSYFSGYEDMLPGNFGEHIKEGMNGLWLPPYRVLENIFAECEEEVLRAEDMTVYPDTRVFHSSGYEFILSVPDNGGIFSVEVRKSLGETRAVSITFRAGVSRVWGLEGEVEHSIEKDDGETVIDIDGGKEKVYFHRIGACQSSIKGNDITFQINGDCRITLSTEKQAPANGNGRRRNGSLSSAISTGTGFLNDTFEWSKINMCWLYSDFGEGRSCITAGQPEFPWFFSIDTFISMEGMLAAGMFDVTKNSLETLFRHAEAQNGRMPHEILASGDICNPGNLEEIAYMPTALKRYYDWTGDGEFVSRHMPAALKGIALLMGSGLGGKGVMEDSNAGEGTDIDTICYFVKGAEDLLTLSSRTGAKLANETKDRLQGEIEKWTAFVRNNMWNSEEKAFAERFVDGSPVMKKFWTTIVPFETGLAREPQYRAFREGPYFREMVTGDGIKVDPSGNIMAVNNGLLAKGALNYGDPDTAWEFHSKSLDTFGKFSTGCFPEITTNSKGCYLQAWTAAMNVENMVKGFLGIHVRSGKIYAEPQFPKALYGSDVTLKNIRAGSTRFDCSFHCDSDGNVEHSITESDE